MIFYLQGQSQQRLEARKAREAKEEEEKRLIDIEEAKFQAEKRKAAIEKAKTQQYYQTDRVKNFHVRNCSHPTKKSIWNNICSLSIYISISL